MAIRGCGLAHERRVQPQWQDAHIHVQLYGLGGLARRTIGIHCAGCRTLLYRYRKGGTGGLVKCFVERITEDRTNGDMKCPACGQEFARAQVISGRPAHKIIQGKVFTRGMRRK